MKPVYGNLQELKVVDDYTVQFVFKGPFTDFPRLLPQGNYCFGIFSPEALKKYGQTGWRCTRPAPDPVRRARARREDRAGAQRAVLGPASAARPHHLPSYPGRRDPSAALRSGEIDILTRVPADAADGTERVATPYTTAPPPANCS